MRLSNRIRQYRLGGVFIGAVLLVGSLATGQGQDATNPHAANTPKLMDQQREITLALSACPRSIAANASVYVLGPSGYTKVRDGGNGFTAIVQHALPNSQEPQCMDAEGTKTLLPRILKVAELRASGKSAEEIRRVVADAYAKGVFRAPSRPGIDYMLSNEIETPNDEGKIEHFPPHVMFYAPYLTNADIGSEGQSGGGPAFVAAEGGPQALIIVPVSDQANSEHNHAMNEGSERQ